MLDHGVTLSKISIIRWNLTISQPVWSECLRNVQLKPTLEEPPNTLIYLGTPEAPPNMLINLYIPQAQPNTLIRPSTLEEPLKILLTNP
jgi:hypothetical protein